MLQQRRRSWWRGPGCAWPSTAIARCTLHAGRRTWWNAGHQPRPRPAEGGAVRGRGGNRLPSTPLLHTAHEARDAGAPRDGIRTVSTCSVRSPIPPGPTRRSSACTRRRSPSPSRVLAELGTVRAFVVHGSNGLDEISNTGESSPLGGARGRGALLHGAAGRLQDAARGHRGSPRGRPPSRTPT